MIHILDIEYDKNEAIKYHEILKEEFMHLHWHYTKNHNDFRSFTSNNKNQMEEVHGWGLQTIYNDPEFPYHCDIDPHDEGHEFFKDTPMNFGFFKKIKELFKNPYRSFLMSFPPKHHIGKWKSGSGPAHGKIFIPIVSNNNTFLISFGEASQKIILEEGKIYFFDMTNNYGEFVNEGNTEITFITFNIPRDSFESALRLKGQI